MPKKYAIMKLRSGMDVTVEFVSYGWREGFMVFNDELDAPVCMVAGSEICIVKFVTDGQ